jgi:hypothetical protein
LVVSFLLAGIVPVFFDESWLFKCDALPHVETHQR